MGTGTTAVVAKEFKRNFIGTEIDSKYMRTANLRLKKKPDANNTFANLKNLRDFVKKNKIKNVKDYKFAKQISKNPSLDSKIYPEEHHQQELFERLSFEERCFGADIRGQKRPEDPLKHNHGLFKQKMSFLSFLLLS